MQFFRLTSEMNAPMTRQEGALSFLLDAIDMKEIEFVISRACSIGRKV